MLPLPLSSNHLISIVLNQPLTFEHACFLRNLYSFLTFSYLIMDRNKTKFVFQVLEDKVP
jgi:hypothetical protein